MIIESPRRTPLSRREIHAFMASFFRAAGEHLRAQCEVTNLTAAVMDRPPSGGN